MRKVTLLCVLVFTLLCAIFQPVFAQNNKMLSPAVSEAQMKEIEALMAPIRLQLNKAMEKKDPSLYKSYLADQKKVASMKDAKDRLVFLKTMDAKYLDFVKNVYASANIDEKAYQSKVKSILGASVGKFKFGPFLSIVGTLTSSPTPSDGSGCKEYTCPFDVTRTTSSGSLIDVGYAIISSDKCGASVYGFTDLAGGGEKTARIGKTVNVPANMSKVDITLEEDYHLKGTVFAVIGGGYGESQVAISMKGPGGLDKVDSKITKWAVAPVIWFTNYEEDAEHEVLTASFTPQSSGGDYTIQAYVRVYEFSGALVAGTVVEANINKIHKMKICFVK